MFLGFYRNSIGRVFAPEGIIVSCVFRHKEGIIKEQLKADVEFVQKLLNIEYFNVEIDLEYTIDSLKKKRVVIETENGILKLGEELHWIIYLGSFIWPFIECYWGLAVYLLFATQNIKINLLWAKVILKIK